MGLDMHLYAEKYENEYDNKTLSYPKELKCRKRFISIFSTSRQRFL